MDLRAFFAIILVFCILVQASTRILILLDFEVRRDFIKEVLCMNRDKPEIKCEGKCFLSGQLEKEKEQHKEFPGKLKAENENFQIFYHNSLELLQNSINISKKSAFNSPVFNSLIQNLIFHPPR
jgi:hypothetical protein